MQGRAEDGEDEVLQDLVREGKVIRDREGREEEV